MADYRGFRPDFVIVDEATAFRAQDLARRQLGDQWDETEAGVRLPPLALGTFVEVWDNMTERAELGQVTVREFDRGVTLYTVRTQHADIRTERVNISVVDLESPEGVDEFLEGDKPRTAEEVIRFLEGEGDA
jgi:hypothetical protein